MDMNTRTKHQSRSLPTIKPKSSVSGGGVTLGRIFLSAKVCTSCVQPLGLFLSRGSNCPKCGLKVCKKCKVYSDHLPSWICLACSKDSPNYGNKSMTIGGNLKYRGDSSYSTIKRSWSIAATNRGSPVLKAYTKYNSDEQRGYNSLPRMPADAQVQNIQMKGGNQSHHHHHRGGQFYTAYSSTSNNAKKDSRTVCLGLEDGYLDFSFQSTLHPYMTNQGQRSSPASSINFIEDEYWDYYDYEVNNSRRSSRDLSCERSLGETVEYRYQHFPAEDPPPLLPPKKPIRTKKGRSKSVGSYDTKEPKYSQLKTYCLVNVTPEQSPVISITSTNSHAYSSLPMKKRRSNSFGKENVSQTWNSREFPETMTRSVSSPQKHPFPDRPIREKQLLSQEYNSHSLPRRIHGRKEPGTTAATVDRSKPVGNNTYNTLPKEWKIFKRKDNNATTIVISGVNCPPNPSDASPLSLPPALSNFSGQPSTRSNSTTRTYISDERRENSAMVTEAPKLPARKFPIKEPYPMFPKKIQPFHGGGPYRELKPLLPLYRGGDQRHGLFDLPTLTPPLTIDDAPTSTTSRGKEDQNWQSPEDSSLSTASGALDNGRVNYADSGNIYRMGEERDINSGGGIREVIIEIRRECDERNNGIPNSILTKGNINNKTTIVPGGDSLVTIEPPIRTVPGSGSDQEGKEVKLEMEADPFKKCDPIDSSSAESDSALSDSSFQSIEEQAEEGDNNGMTTVGSLGVKVIRGEDKDEFKSCNGSSEEEYDEGRDLNEQQQKELHPQNQNAKEPLPLHDDYNPPPSSSVVLHTPEISLNPIQKEEEKLGLSDQGDQRVKCTPSSISSDDYDDTMVLEEVVSDPIISANENIPSAKRSPAGMSTPDQLASQKQLRKYKSRVLIGLNENQTVEVSGEGEVEIVVGKGTFLHNEFDRNSGREAKEEERERSKGPYGTVKITEEDTAKNASRSKEQERSASVPDSLANSFRRESPEGEESGSEDHRSQHGEESGKGSSNPLPAPRRSDPDGADAERSEESSSTPILEMNSEDEAKSESTDSWTEEVTFMEMDADRPAPLDMTLHTICEESETESECRRSIPTHRSEGNPSNPNQGIGLEKYFNFTSTTDGDGIQNLQFDFQNYEESEFSDTFSESSFSSELRNSGEYHPQMDMDEGDAVELASGRLEKYFMNLGVVLSNDSDSVGSESESGSSILENKKKVLKHHRRSAEYEDEHYEVSEDDDCAFEQEGFDTIKKQRKLRKSQEDLLSQSHVLPGSRKSSSGSVSEDRSRTPQAEEPVGHRSPELSAPRTRTPLFVVETDDPHVPVQEPPPMKLKRVATVSRSNSFNWSSDEEVNLMMRSLRQLIKNMTLSKKPDEGKGEKLLYLENELIRLMKNDNMKNIVETMSSDSEDQQDVYKLFETASDNQPELLSKVMTHIGERLSTWMKGEEETEDAATIKCAQSVSSDLNDDLESDTRFSWKGSFESTLAKRQSVGSSDSLDYYAPPPNEAPDVFSDRSILRSSSLHHLAHTQPILEESESLTSSLSRLHPPPASSGSTGNGNGTGSIAKSKSLFLDPKQREVKSARYRPPGYFDAVTNDTHSSTPVLSNRRDRLNPMEDTRKEIGKGFTIRGLIEFSMQYNYKNATFEVCIKQCRDLAAVDAKKGRSDPYVKGYLLPDRTKSNKRKTKTKKNTLNPVFGETLKFQISLEDLEGRTLSLSIWHSDMFGKNEFLGQVTLPLRGLTFDDTNFKWYPLREEKTPSEDEGPQESPPLELILALKWTQKGFNRDRGNLSVLIKDAKGLKLIKNSVPSTFIKCTPISERSKKQKTSLARRSRNPVWNATMTFEGVSSDGVEVAIYNSDLLNHEQIGNVILDCDSELWQNMWKREGFWVEGTVQLTTN